MVSNTTTLQQLKYKIFENLSVHPKNQMVRARAHHHRARIASFWVAPSLRTRCAHPKDRMVCVRASWPAPLGVAAWARAGLGLVLSMPAHTQGGGRVLAAAFRCMCAARTAGRACWRATT